MNVIPCRFDNRTQAGLLLADRLASMNLAKPVVFALPRGGVPVGLEIANALNAPLDVVLVREIGAPGEPELALGAVVDGEKAQTVVNEDIRRITGASAAFLERPRKRELARSSAAGRCIWKAAPVSIQPAVQRSSWTTASPRAPQPRRP